MRAFIIDAMTQTVQPVTLTRSPLDWNEVADIIECVHVKPLLGTEDDPLFGIEDVAVLIDGARTHGYACFQIPGYQPILGRGLVIGHTDGRYHDVLLTLDDIVKRVRWSHRNRDVA
jgi:hypothetical protein